MTTPTLRRALPAVALAVTVGLAAGGCGGSSSSDDSTPAEALSAAKKAMDASSSWHLTLSTDAEPDDNGVIKADGVGTHDPQAWKGDVGAVIKGLHASIPIVAVDGKVYAKLPFTLKYTTIDPDEYGAPDPAGFMDPDTGLSTLLTELDGAKKTDTARAGSQIVTTYAGTLSGTDVKAIIPSASASGTFETTVNINKDHQVTSVSVTGPFFSDSDSVTYDLTVDDYGQDVKITAP